jgi:hypothetical protein
MTSAANKSKWDEFYQNVFHGWNTYRNDQSTKVESARERSINILQKRYGYTREEAISQLDKHYSKAWLG